MKVQSSLMGVGGLYECLAAGWLADMRSKQVPTSTTSARRLAALSKLPFFLFYLHFLSVYIPLFITTVLFLLLFVVPLVIPNLKNIWCVSKINIFHQSLLTTEKS